MKNHEKRQEKGYLAKNHSCYLIPVISRALISIGQIAL